MGIYYRVLFVFLIAMNCFAENTCFKSDDYLRIRDFLQSRNEIKHIVEFNHLDTNNYRIILSDTILSTYHIGNSNIDLQFIYERYKFKELDYVMSDTISYNLKEEKYKQENKKKYSELRKMLFDDIKKYSCNEIVLIKDKNYLDVDSLNPKTLIILEFSQPYKNYIEVMAYTVLSDDIESTKYALRNNHNINTYSRIEALGLFCDFLLKVESNKITILKHSFWIH